jgi:hypothetical protein
MGNVMTNSKNKTAVETTAKTAFEVLCEQYANDEIFSYLLSNASQTVIDMVNEGIADGYVVKEFKHCVTLRDSQERYPFEIHFPYQSTFDLEMDYNDWRDIFTLEEHRIQLGLQKPTGEYSYYNIQGVCKQVFSSKATTLKHLQRDYLRLERRIGFAKIYDESDILAKHTHQALLKCQADIRRDARILWNNTPKSKRTQLTEWKP